MNTENALGIYIHIPFCTKKCPYCDFYSISAKESHMEEYSAALDEEIKKLHRSKNFTDKNIKMRAIDSIYFGGGTPSVFGAKRIAKTLDTLRHEYKILPKAEITVECNPSSVSEDFFYELASCGINRISLGLQSALDSERQALGRTASALLAQRAVNNAKQAGIKNISLDLMLGIPHSSEEKLRQSADFCLELDIPHISAYMLKIEANTPFAKNISSLQLPPDDEVSDMYLFLCDYLRLHGLSQYEISNFSKKGYESRHNLKYWNCEEYLGLGPSAHSFISGKRFYFDSSLQAFLDEKAATFDSFGGSFSEYAMLRLRLSEGLQNKLVQKRFKHPIPSELYKAAAIFAEHGLLHLDEGSIRLLPEGFLLSNTIINTLLASI